MTRTNEQLSERLMHLEMALSTLGIHERFNPALWECDGHFVNSNEAHVVKVAHPVEGEIYMELPAIRTYLEGLKGLIPESGADEIDYEFELERAIRSVWAHLRKHGLDREDNSVIDFLRMPFRARLGDYGIVRDVDGAIAEVVAALEAKP